MRALIWIVRVVFYLVHVLHPGEHVDFSGIFSSLTLPSDGSEGDISGEEEEETNKSQKRNDQSGQVEAGFSRCRV